MPALFFVYLSAVFLAAVAMGIQVTLVPWYAVVQLEISAVELGWLQACGFLPLLLLIPLGGVTADRTVGRRSLLFWYVLMGSTHLMMGVAVYQGFSTLSVLLLYVLVLALSQAFIQPLRDRFLSYTAVASGGGQVQKAVVWVSLATYVAQAIGMIVMAQVDHIGVAVLMLIQAGLIYLCCSRYLVLF